jgi:hypothetical protein
MGAGQSQADPERVTLQVEDAQAQPRSGAFLEFDVDRMGDDLGVGFERPLIRLRRGFDAK